MQLPKRAFIFVRHGETDFNREGRLQGRVDVPLNGTGKSQADRVVEQLMQQTTTRVVASPAIRVLQTIRPYAEASGLPVQLDSGLLEYFVGSFEGKRISEIRESHLLDDLESWMSVLPGDAEEWREFESRVVAAVYRWTEEFPDETVLFASHGLVFHALANVLTGEEMISKNAEAHHFQPTSDGWSIAPLDEIQ